MHRNYNRMVSSIRGGLDGFGFPDSSGKAKKAYRFPPFSVIGNLNNLWMGTRQWGLFFLLFS